MADNTTLPGAGEIVRDKDRSGVKTQIVSLDVDPAGGAEHLLGDTYPLPARLNESGTTVFLTTTPLANGASIDTGWIDTSKLGAGFTIIASADQNGTIYHDHSPDAGTHVATTPCTTPYVANEAHSEGHTAYARYTRFRFVNTSGSAQTAFWFTVVQRHSVHWSTVKISGVADTNVTSVPTDPFGVNADAASVSGSISAKLRQIATNGIPVKEQAATTGGCDPYTAISTAAVLAANIKNSAGQIYGWAITNTTAAPLYVRLYDLATSPAGTDTPDIRLMIPANGGNNLSLPQGHACANGIGIRASAGVADNDGTALTANALLINIFIK